MELMQLSLFDKSPVQRKITNVASVPHRSPFRYPGGKTWFVPVFRQWMKSKEKKPCLLIEPFAGGGIISLTAVFENLVDRAVLVEKDEDVAAVWEVILERNYERLVSEILNFNLTFKNVKKILDSRTTSIYHKALQTIIRNRVSHGGIMANGSGLTKHGEKGKGLSSRWYPTTLARRIQDIGSVRDRISFIRGCGFDIIKKYKNTTNSCFFIDPPYTASGKSAGKRLYKHHEIDHKHLFKIFSKCSSDFLFTYDMSEEIVRLAQLFNFQISMIPMKNTHNTKMEELIIGKDLSWLSLN